MLNKHLKGSHRFVTLFVALLLPFTAAAEVPMAVGVGAGTNGLGVQFHAGVTETLNLRLGLHHFSGSLDVDAEDSNGAKGDELRYSGDLELNNLSLLADWYPTGGNFHISAGAVLNNNDLTVDARCNNPSGCEVGGNSFSRTEIGTITTDIDTDNFGPYVGIGWGNPVGGETGIHWSFELGVIYQGEPSVTMTSDGTCAGFVALCRNALDDEEQELEDDLSDLRFYPVVSLGLSYRFK